MTKKNSLEYYFASTGFYDLLPVAIKLIRELGFSKEEALEAICKVADKARVYPPTKNREAWFAIVFKEKLYEARADILAFKNCKRLLF
ncbi:hypothetical protein SPSYN_02094 [Sporotomaculum syntrophicum]|uniref:Uncharacterized protein n=1 Tax=Sporotomaculum syntrophicum TaxID=182264 RepID=A0A9D2WNT4_9FIRM|nr:hypothetical protein [Sporotomaculum syntrophicum]KAF1084318.1 hypothetical protein SPSYN_02094 [Sporotomaculum syntrophicum]